jgi:sterol desaturase/sphingolipid hydroxylase (fatty acid hydroxylase superfamily)
MADQSEQSSAISKPPLYVSTKNETVRMFDSNFMEFFSRVHPATPLILYLPVVGFMLYVALWRQGFPVSVVVGFFLLGTLLWTLLEYLIHRYIFHHDYPNDARRLVMPPSISVPLAFVFYGIFLPIFGRFTSSAFAGLVFGYICYDMLHYATHHFPMKRGVLLWLKQYHLRHHYKDDHRGYGISSPLWDYVFRTTRR